MNEEHKSREHLQPLGFADSIRMWDQAFAGTESSEEFNLIANQAIHDLDEQACKEFGLGMGEECVASGFGVWTETEVVADGSGTERFESKAHEEYIVAKTGYFGGFAFRKFNDGDRPRLCYMFRLGVTGLKSDKQWLDGRTDCMFIDPETAVIISSGLFEEPYLDMEGSESVLEDEQQRLDQLSERSNAFAQLIQSEGFRFLSRDEQIKTVDTIIYETEILTNVRESAAIFSAERGYIAQPDAEDITDLMEVDLRDMLLSGVCLALRTPRHEDEGLMVSIEIDANNKFHDESLVKPKTIVHIPFSGQKLSFGFR